MYREHAGPPPPDPFEAAAKNARTCGHVQLGAVGMMALSVLLLAMQLGPSKSYAFMSAETKTAVLLYAVGYLLVAGAWAALNAWGLRRRSRIAHWSSIGFAVMLIATCFGWVFGAGLFFLLFKKEMKGYYDARLES